MSAPAPDRGLLSSPTERARAAPVNSIRACCERIAQQVAGACSGVLPIAQHDVCFDDRGRDAIGFLLQALRASLYLATLVTLLKSMLNA